MKVGFTGTRKGMSEAQDKQLHRMLRCIGAYNAATLPERVGEFHCGGSIGADSAAFIIAQVGEYAFKVHVHPAPGVVRESLSDGATWHEVYPPLTRNRNIVAAADILIAAPETDTEELRSGTWATVRYARQKGIPIVMLSRGGA